MTECIFCQIIQKEIPSYKVYENDQVYAFLDITQTTKGHTLVVPKKHITDIFEYDSKDANNVFAAIPKIARALEKAFPDMKGLNIVNNNRAIAYQSVFHSHIHLIPRYEKEDTFSIQFADNAKLYSNETMAMIAKTIAKQVRE